VRKTAFLPCIPTRGERVPSHPDWIHEVKHDGYRLIVQREGKRVRLWTRNGYDWSGRFPLISDIATWTALMATLAAPIQRSFTSTG
jgi:bifunctional non-homologous end joining protein LigD